MNSWSRFWSRLFGRIPCLRRKVLVNFEDGKTAAIQGVLFEQRGGWLVLKSAAMVPAPGQLVPMDGDVIIECAKVAFIQAFGS